MTLRTIPGPLKVLFTCLLLTLGLAYLFAVGYLYLIEIEPHTGKGEGLVAAVVGKYYGKREGTQLGAALKGAMGENITRTEKEAIFRWIEAGAKASEFSEVQPIFENGCVMCHSRASGMPIPPLGSYEEVSAYTKLDMGQSIKSLVRVSHVHLFGMSFIFFLTGGIFALSTASERWRITLISTPFISIWVDIGSWWFTKLEPVFAYTVIIGGGLMGLALLFQILISLWDMWFSSTTRRHKDMKTQTWLLAIIMLLLSSGVMDIARADSDHRISAFTLRTAMEGERRLFVGVGGKIDGQVNPTLPVHEWDVVKITLLNDDGLKHHITLPSFFITSEEVSEKGHRTTITFVPFKRGGYGYFCILDNHRALGMEGLLVVTP